MSTISLWRIAATVGKYRADDLSGAGAAAVGGRYNSAGIAVVYTSSSVALAVLETLVHLGVKAGGQANRYLVELHVPLPVYEARQTLTVAQLRRQHPFWDAVPFAEASQRIGDEWVRAGKSALLALPSAILPHQGLPDGNVLINPRHADAGAIRVARCEKFIYDPRLGPRPA
ncbi:RES family NAD+ phosphorylase [Bordetella pseudohinzii]|uniref:Uncharacterized conserved protein n=1 Tax=Bordetella pseudohinzii TaxID=1331258 RepID=A0A0J6BTT8_9BORD|nr:RES family NAD+ phosphorylase [Bordetella pseudohinzii]ANY16264.1 hypothetical protein BBN53_10375 [Bordetella pseudohinzii]KMM25234.1 hypothetical protein L540_20410 [Bordetella pseudohinzii]KXA75959.1 hypothetical protein AW877_18295 [Bordetella pseudohinzii]KXA77994.1 hypothetical protein AW878_13990 [Bordetella pseudohinzii]CUJ14676.1 Uncharacterized conserved protein [Bordetella pseudohinzii]